MEWFIAFFQISSVVAVTAVAILLVSLLVTTIIWSIAGYGIQILRAKVPALLQHAARHTEAPSRTVYNSLSHDIVRPHKLKTS